MTTHPFRPEEKLEGSGNYNSWKAGLTTILEENDLDDLVFNTIDEPTMTRRIIYDLVKETLMPTITSLKTAKECFDTLIDLYEKKAPSHKRVLKKRL